MLLDGEETQWLVRDPDLEGPRNLRPRQRGDRESSHATSGLPGDDPQPCSGGLEIDPEVAPQQELSPRPRAPIAEVIGPLQHRPPTPDRVGLLRHSPSASVQGERPRPHRGGNEPDRHRPAPPLHTDEGCDGHQPADRKHAVQPGPVCRSRHDPIIHPSAKPPLPLSVPPRDHRRPERSTRFRTLDEISSRIEKVVDLACLRTTWAPKSRSAAPRPRPTCAAARTTRARAAVDV